MRQFLLSEGTAARRRIPIVLVDDTDGKTPETGITFSAGDIKVSKNGGAEANHAGTVTELATGDYYYEATAGELDTLGYLTIKFTKSGVRTFRASAQVISINLYDSVRAGLTSLPNAVAGASGGLGLLDSSLRLAADFRALFGTVLTEGAAGRLKAAFTTFFDVVTPVFTTASVNQSGDSFGRIGATGSGLTSLAPSATAVSSVDYTPTRAGKLDFLDVSILSRAAAATALSNVDWTGARAALLDKLNISGNVASSAEVTSIQNNTRVVRVVPSVIERPDSGTITFRIEVLLYDSVGNMEAPDSAPTISLVNQSGTDLSARLDSTTMSLVSTGRYRSIYTASVGDTLEQLMFGFSVIEGGATRLYGNTAVIVDTTAVDFTATDRANLGSIKGQTDQFTFTVNGFVDSNVADWGDNSLTMVAVGGLPTVNIDTINATALGSIWNRLLTAITTAGSIGKLIKDNLDVAVSTRQASGNVAVGSMTNAAMDALITRDNQRDVDLDVSGAAPQSKAISVLTRTSRQHSDLGDGTLLTYRKDGTTVALTQAQDTDDNAKPVVDIGVGA